MICTELWNGQGLGNQLHSYIMCRVLAMDKNTEWGVSHTERFKGLSFMNLEFGLPVIGGTTVYEGGNPEQLPDGVSNFYREKKIENNEAADIRNYDWEGINNIRDNTKIEGLWQGEKYYEHHRERIDSWLEVEPIDLGDNVCIINFRGGEYTIFPDLFLTKEYWNRAIAHMLSLNPNMIFRVVTDDVETARLFFPHYEIQHEIGKDWRSIRYAKYLILSNSSFAILPAWLNKEAYVIAPWGWARHNVGYWALEQNKMRGWKYQKLDGAYEVYS